MTRPIPILPNQRGQTFIEYSVLVGLVLMVVMVMSPALRRGAQGMVKVVADQIGEQNESDQQGGKSGHFEKADISTSTERATRAKDRLGAVSYEFEVDRSSSHSDQYSNLGFSGN